MVATLLDPKLNMGLFLRREVDQAELLLVPLVAEARTETFKNKSQERKESPMEGSHEEEPLIENIIKQTVFLPRINTSRLWMRKAVAPPRIHLSQKKNHLSKEMEATHLNVPKCKSNVCPLHVQMGQCQRYPELETIA